MKNCSEGHPEVVFNCDNCPVCNIKATISESLKYALIKAKVVLGALVDRVVCTCKEGQLDNNCLAHSSSRSGEVDDLGKEALYTLSMGEGLTKKEARKTNSGKHWVRCTCEGEGIGAKRKVTKKNPTCKKHGDPSGAK